MSTERLDIVIREDGSRVVKRNIADIGKEATSSARGVQLLQRALGGLAVGAGLLFLQRQVDEYTNLQNRLRLVTKSTADLRKVNDELFASANRTRSEYSSTVDLYAALARSSKDLGVSQKDLLQITETVNQAVKVSGTDSVTAAQGIRQLGQALASGVLRGDEFNSIMENMPRLAQAIADSMGVGLGKLRAMAAEGKLTAREVIQAMRQAAPQIAAEFQKITPTISDAFTVLRNNVMRFVGEANMASGASALIARAIMALAGNLGILAQAVETAIVAFVLFRAALAVQALSAYVQSLMAVQIALGATTAQAFRTGVAMRAFNALLANLKVILGGLALAGVAAGLVYFANAAASANGVLSSLKDTSQTAVNELLDMEAKARGAGMQVDSLGNAAALSNPLLAAVAKQYGHAADEAQRLAINARQAAIAVAQGKIAELQGQRAEIMGPIDDLNSSNPLKQARGTVKMLGSGLFGGPGFEERFAGGKRIDDTIGIYQRQIELLKKAPEGFFAPDPIKGGGGTGDGKKKKGGGEGFNRAEFLQQLNRDLDNSTQLTGILDSQWRSVQEQIMGVNAQLQDSKVATLTEDETFALAQKIERLQELNALEQTRDNIMRQFVEPQKEFVRTQEAANQLLAAGIITQGQYVVSLEDARLAVLALNEDAASGIERGLIMVTRQARNEAQRLEQSLVNAYNNIRGPQQGFADATKAVNALLAAGKIDGKEYAEALRDIRIEYLRTRTDMASGLELGRLETQKDNENVGARVARAYQGEYRRANDEVQSLTDSFAALKQLMIDDPINSGYYANQLKIVSAQLEAAKPDASFFDGMRGALADFVADFRGVLPGLRQAWTQTFQRIGDGVANALARAVVYGESLGDALKSVAREALAELISALIKMGIQWLVMQVIGTTAQAGIAAAGVAAGTATAAAWAPAAAAVSLATFGANSAPAMAGIASTYALTTALSQVSGALGKGFREGGYTGNGGTGDVAGVVHGREFVVNADATAQWLPFLEQINAGRMPGYASGGLVKPLGSGSATGSRGVASPADTGLGGRPVMQFNIDARGSEAGVEEKIEDALRQFAAEFEPELLRKAQRNQDERERYAMRRQRIGGAR